MNPNKMSWEEYIRLRDSNEFRTGEYEAIYAIELRWVGTEGSSNSVMESRAHEILETEEILAAHIFQRMYETYEELRERNEHDEHNALQIVMDIHQHLLRYEGFKDTYTKQLKHMLVERYEDEWGTYHKFLEAHPDLIE